MSRSRMFLALAVVPLVSFLCSSPPALASGFNQAWSVSGWNWSGELGNTDTDVQPEMLFFHAGDGHFAVFDGLHGTVDKEFPAFNPSNAAFAPYDLDGDGRSEFFVQSATFVVPPFFHVYRWNGSDYATILSHADSVALYGLSPYRASGSPELWELSADPSTPPCDLRLRDLAGNVLFRASSDIPGWAGPYRQSIWVDRNGDGVTELLIEDQASIRMMNQYFGSFAVAWTLAGWQAAVELGNLDSDSQSELLVVNSADGHHALVDMQTGVVQQEFPAFVSGEAFLFVQDVDHDGRGELVVTKIVTGQPPVFSIHRWNGAVLASMVSVTATSEFSNFGLLALRNPIDLEIVEQSPSDFLLRDLAGSTLFQASTFLPGWSVAPFTAAYDGADLDGDGIPELILHDPSHVWAVEYSGGFAPAWVANGWGFFQQVGSVDADDAPEFMFTSSSDQRFALFDGATGTMQQDFPAFTSQTASYVTLDVDFDGQTELFFGRLPSAPPLFTAHHWNGSSFVPTSSHTQPIGQWSPIQLRGPSQFEFLENHPADIQVRDLAGAVIFRASTDLPDWSGQSAIAAPVNFPSQFGPPPLLFLEQGRTRLVFHDGPIGTPGAPVAGALRVFQNAPNPFRTTTAFRLTNPSAGEVGIRLYDAAGRLVRTLDRRLPAGEHTIHWDGRDAGGRSVPSGVLFYEVTAGGIRQTRKMIRTS